MMKRIGLIGCGNMGGAILGGLLSSGLVPAEDLMASTIDETDAARIRSQYGIRATCDNTDIVSFADIIILAVKPYIFPVVIPEIRDQVRDDQLIISIAAGQTIAKIESAFAKPIHLIRVMPNTPAMVGASMSAICRNPLITDEELDAALQIFSSFGIAEVVDEHLIDTVTGVSGSSPAYVYMMIEAMADAAVADGMPRAQAYRFAAQSVLGAAKMVLETGRHPGDLKDAVCSPGGTTIAAVAELEAAGFRSAVIRGQRACVQKSREMSE